MASFTPHPPIPDACVGSTCLSPEDSLWFETAPADEALLLLGTPVLRLQAALDGQRVNVVAALFDINPNGRAQRLHPRGFAINPELRHGVSQVAPVVPGEVMDLEMSGVGVAHRPLPGHRLRLMLTTPGNNSATSRHYAPLFGYGSNVDVHLGGAQPTRVELPVVAAPRLWEDPRQTEPPVVGEGYARPGVTWRVSSTPAGGPADGGSGGIGGVAVSADGGAVAFQSAADDLLVEGNTAFEDVFVWDRAVEGPARVSVAADGTPGDGPSYRPGLSADGRYVVFDSRATNFDEAGAARAARLRGVPPRPRHGGDAAGVGGGRRRRG